MPKNRVITGTELYTQAKRVAVLLNEHMLEYPDNNELLQYVLAKLFGSVENFETQFYQYLTEAQKHEFQATIDSLAAEQRNKKKRFHSILAASGLTEIINKLRQVQIGQTTKALNTPDNFRPDSTPYNAETARRSKEQQQKK